MCMAINKSYFSTVGPTQSSTYKETDQTDLVRQGLTQHTAQSKTSHSKVEIPPTYTTDCEN